MSLVIGVDQITDEEEQEPVCDHDYIYIETVSGWKRICVNCFTETDCGEADLGG